MTKRISKRRGTLYATLGLLALLTLGRIAWSYRPLNETELRIVGDWTLVPHGTDPALSTTSISFAPDRRFHIHMRGIPDLPGNWNATPKGLAQSYDEDWLNVVVRYAESIARLENPFPARMTTRFVDANTIEELADGRPVFQLLRQSPEGVPIVAGPANSFRPVPAAATDAPAATDEPEHPRFYTVIDPENPHVILEDGTQMRVEGAPAGTQIDIDSLIVTGKRHKTATR